MVLTSSVRVNGYVFKIYVMNLIFAVVKSRNENRFYLMSRTVSFYALTREKDIFKIKISDKGRVLCSPAVIVIIYGNDTYAGKCGIPYVYVFNVAAAFFRRLDGKAVEQSSRIAVPNVDTVYSARHLASNGKCVTARKSAVKNLHVSRRTVYNVALGILARLDSYAIVTRIKLAVEDRAIHGGIGVPSVAVPDTVGNYLTVICENILAEHKMKVP